MTARVTDGGQGGWWETGEETGLMEDWVESKGTKLGEDTEEMGKVSGDIEGSELRVYGRGLSAVCTNSRFQ